jgi:hypothetical protein
VEVWVLLPLATYVEALINFLLIFCDKFLDDLLLAREFMRVKYKGVI